MAQIAQNMIHLLLLGWIIIGLVQGDCISRGYEHLSYKKRSNYNCLSCINFNVVTKKILRFVCDFSGNTNQDLYDNYHTPGYGNQIYSSRIKIMSTENTGNIELVKSELYEKYVLKNVEKLDFSKNNISKINPGYFMTIPDLKELILADNKLTSINDDVLLEMPELQTLNMSHNSISIVNEFGFKYLLNLFIIDLSFNRITSLPENVFKYQNHLELILLNNNQIKHFSLNLNTQVVQPSVDLSFNILSTFDMPYILKNISLSNNRLTYFSLPDSESLVALNLSHNSIHTLNGSIFVNAENLRVLDLNHNFISSMPTSSFKNVKKLEYVDISHNLFHESTYGVDNNWISFFFNSQFLKTVHLDGNGWSCSDLKDIMHSLTSQGIQIIEGNQHDNDNMLGINCRDVANNRSDKVKFDPFESVQMLVDQRINQEINETRSNIAYLSSKIEEMSKRLNKFMLRENLTKASNVEERDKILTDHFAAVLDEKISKLQIPKQEKSYAEAHKMEKLVIDQSTSNTGSIITNILLTILLCGLGFLIYTQYKGKRISTSSVRENINLV